VNESFTRIESSFQCDLYSLTDEQRLVHADLTARLVAAVLEKRELAEGFAFRVDAEKVPLDAIGQWIELERKCCPFFGFRMEIEPERGAIWLQLNGRVGVKEFIRAELKL
jgi:hypothetical protein